MNEPKLDWNAVWMNGLRRNWESGLGGGCTSAWMDEATARQFYERASQGQAVAERLEDLLDQVGVGDSVLDIGAGPGNLSVPVAKKAGRVTCVEPADGMRIVLAEQVHAAGLDNVQIVPKTWDAVEPADLIPPYRLCYASYSLGMLDLRAALEKMIAVTRGTIVLYWHAGDQPYDREARVLWPLLRGMRHDPIPKSDVVFNLLYQMGIYPNVRPLRSIQRTVFASFEVAAADYRRRYGLTTTGQEDLLRRYLEETLVREGETYVRSAVHHGMKIWWETGVGDA